MFSTDSVSRLCGRKCNIVRLEHVEHMNSKCSIIFNIIPDARARFQASSRYTPSPSWRCIQRKLAKHPHDLPSSAEWNIHVHPVTVQMVVAFTGSAIVIWIKNKTCIQKFTWSTDLWYWNCYNASGEKYNFCHLYGIVLLVLLCTVCQLLNKTIDKNFIMQTNESC
jgi:hypothetical protein